MLRKCAGCGKLLPRENLIKITKEYKSGNIIIQPNSFIFGRSVYLCYNQECKEKALKKDRLKRALKYKGNEDLKGLLDGQLKS